MCVCVHSMHMYIHVACMCIYMYIYHASFAPPLHAAIVPLPITLSPPLPPSLPLTHLRFSY